MIALPLISEMDLTEKKIPCDIESWIEIKFFLSSARFQFPSFGKVFRKQKTWNRFIKSFWMKRNFALFHVFCSSLCETWVLKLEARTSLWRARFQFLSFKSIVCFWGLAKITTFVAERNVCPFQNCSCKQITSADSGFGVRSDISGKMEERLNDRVIPSSIELRSAELEW